MSIFALLLQYNEVVSFSKEKNNALLILLLISILASFPFSSRTMITYLIFDSENKDIFDFIFFLIVLLVSLK